MGDVSYSFQTKFKNNVEAQLQLMANPLEKAVVWGDDTSAELVKMKDLIGNNAPQENDTRNGRTKWNETTFDGVWLGKPNELYDARLTDNSDKLSTEIDLQGAATMSAAGTLNRAKTMRILEGFYGPIVSGKPRALVTTAFPAGQVIAVTEGAAAADKMNLKKIRAAAKLLTQGYVPDEAKRWMVLTADDNDNLLADIQATNADYKAAFGADVVGGQVRSLLGFEFIHLELDNVLLGTVPALATDGSGYRKTPFWAQGGLVGNYWQRLRSKIGEIAELQFNVGTLAGTTLASSRTQPGMSGVILNVKG